MLESIVLVVTSMENEQGKPFGPPCSSGTMLEFRLMEIRTCGEIVRSG